MISSYNLVLKTPRCSNVFGKYRFNRPNPEGTVFTLQKQATWEGNSRGFTLGRTLNLTWGKSLFCSVSEAFTLFPLDYRDQTESAKIAFIFQLPRDPLTTLALRFF